MTEDEMAKEYCNNEVPFDTTDSGEKLYTENDLKHAYLAGLKAGKDMAEADLATIAYMHGAERYKTKWHKVADGEYPPCENDNYSIKVLTDCGNIAYYNYSLDCWVTGPSSAEIDPPIAWCELPKFEE